MLSAILFFALYNVLTIMGVPSGTWQDVVLGASIVVFGIFSQRNSKGVVK
jgi:ribose transport system permease protein